MKPIAAIAVAALLMVGCGQDTSSTTTGSNGAATTSATGGTGGSTTGTSGSGSTSTSGSSSGSGGSAGNGSTSASSGDSCPFANGVSGVGEKRFAYGANYAWRNWATDFGGAYGNPGLSANLGGYQDDFAAMKSAGATVVRWWMFPTLSVNDSIQFGSDGAPSGIGGSLVADVQGALALADQNDVYLILTVFSFDDFGESGNPDTTLQSIVSSPQLTQETMTNLITPIAQAVESSPYKKRLLAWDMINEPEWAISDSDPYGDPAFGTPTTNSSVTFAQMETFLTTMARTLHASSSSPVTIGSAAIKWPNAWKHVGLDFYTLHYYDWVYQWFPYTSVTLSSVGLTDKPTMMGEFPNTGLDATPLEDTSTTQPALSVEQFSQALWDNGYGGAMVWAYESDWDTASIDAFHNDHPCETAY